MTENEKRELSAALVALQLLTILQTALALFGIGLLVQGKFAETFWIVLAIYLANSLKPERPKSLDKKE